MQEEHSKQILSCFEKLDKCLEEGNWTPVTEKRGVSVSYCAFPGDSVSTFKGEGLIAKHPKEVLNLLIDENKRGDWDIFFEDGGLINRISETEGYVYYQTKPYGYTVWPRDFVMAISAKILESDIDGEQSAKFVGCSVELEEKPAISSHVRGKINLGGYHLVPVKSGDEIHTSVTYILNVDAAGWIPHSVADMANTYQPLSIIGMRKALTGTTIHP